MKKKRIIVCDYDNPKGYTFPSFGFGSSEKRLWHFAKTVSELDDFEVVVTGPLWLPKYIPNAKHYPKRLDSNTCAEFVKEFGQFDYLFAGHEYFDKAEWVEPFEKCAKILISYQLHPYKYKKACFNGKTKFLFCYSDEMLLEYRDQKPFKALLFHSGVDEEPFFVEKPKNYLLWIGRLDKDKAPHYAVKASKIIGMPLYVLGKSVYQPNYYESHKNDFEAENIKLMGTVFGKEKMSLIANAACAIYTIDKEYAEAGAGVLGEILSCGVPIAGMTWKGNDAICAAVEENFTGAIINANQFDDRMIPDALAQGIKKCLKLDRKKVYQIGKEKFDPHRLVRNIFEVVEKNKKLSKPSQL